MISSTFREPMPVLIHDVLDQLPHHRTHELACSLQIATANILKSLLTLCSFWYRRRRSNNNNNMDMDMSPVTSLTSRSFIYQSSKSTAYFPMFFEGGGVSAAGGEQNDFISCPRPPQETMTATVVGNTSRIEGKESMDMQQNKAPPRIKKRRFWVYRWFSLCP